MTCKVQNARREKKINCKQRKVKRNRRYRVNEGGAGGVRGGNVNEEKGKRKIHNGRPNARQEGVTCDAVNSAGPHSNKKADPEEGRKGRGQIGLRKQSYHRSSGERRHYLGK